VDKRLAPCDFAQLDDSGTSGDGIGNHEVTEAHAPKVLAIKSRFKEILATPPVPNSPRGKGAPRSSVASAF